MEMHLPALEALRRALMRSACAAVMIAGALGASAQLSSDQVPHARTLPLNEDVRHQLETSRFHLGVFRVQPAFAIRDLGYDNNVFGTVDNPVTDWRSTVSAGLRSIVPIGPKVYFRGD